MSFSATFYFDGGPAQGHEIIRYNHGFIQGRDGVGRPNTEVYSSLTAVRLVAQDDAALTAWMLNPHERRNARVVFRRLDQDSVLKETYFEDAYCIFLKDYLDTRGVGTATSFTIDLYLSPKQVQINGLRHKGAWE